MEVARTAHDTEAMSRLSLQLYNAQQEKDGARAAILQHFAETRSSYAERRKTRETKLRALMDQALADYEEVVAVQREMLMEPSGAPHPDGTFQLQEPGNLRHRKYERYLEAKAALYEFLQEQE